MESTQPHINIFIAYSREDKSYLERLKTHLRPLDRNNENLNIWYDGEIVAGQIWDKEIKKHIHNDEIIIALISADSLASDYFYDEELKHALKRHLADETILIPIIIRSCGWHETTRLGEIQVLPKDGKPISKWDDMSDAYTDIIKGISKNISIVLERKKEEARLKAEQEAKINQRLKDAHEALENKNFAEAKKYISSILSIEPNHKKANETLIEINQTEQREKEIKEHFKNAREALKNKNFLGAKEYIGFILKLAPNHKEANELLVRVNEAEDREKEIEKHLRNAREALKNKNFSEVEKHLRLMLSIAPNHREVKEMLVRANEAEEREKEIEKHLENARETLKNKNFAEARESIKLALSINLNHEEAKKTLLKINYAEKREKQIEKHLQNAHKALKNKEFEEAKQHIDSILKIAPNRKEAKEILLKIDQAEEREKQIEQHLRDAREALKNKEFKEAKIHARSVLELDLKNTEAKDIIRQCNREQRDLLSKELKNPLAIAMIIAILVNIFLTYKVLKEHEKLKVRCTPKTGDCRNGSGTLKYKDGRVYNGEWIDGKFEGRGTFDHGNGQQYTGNWKNNQRHGEGVFHYSDGSTYTGGWKNNKRHGKGIMYNDKDTLKGKWTEGEFQPE